MHDRRQAGNGQGGFSLVELLVAMTVTLIITGAVFQLVAAGQNAFQKEPQLSDRQQNIRLAMDLISHDLYRAGYGIPPFGQIFTDNLDGVGIAGSSGSDSDVLEMFLATECPTLTVCPVTGQAGKSVSTREPLSSCYQFPTLVLLGDQETWALRWAEKPGAGQSASCDGAAPGTKSGHAVFPPGQAPLVNPTGGFGGWQPEYLLVGQAVRYRLNLEADGVPSLERSAAGGQDDPDGNSTWEIIARGVEDLQVEYENGTGWHSQPGTISCGINCAAPTPADYDTVVRRVRVRLSARTTGGGNLTGQTTSAVGDAVRGQLVTDIAPRAAASTLGMAAGDL